MGCLSTRVCPISSAWLKMSLYCSGKFVNCRCCKRDRCPGTNPAKDTEAPSPIYSLGTTTSVASIMPIWCPAWGVTGSDWRLFKAIYTASPLSKVGLEDIHKGRLRLGSKQTVCCSQGFAIFTKQTDSTGTCSPCSKAAWIALELSEVELVVAVCVTDDETEVWVGLGSAESALLAWKLLIGLKVTVHQASSICTWSGTIKSILMSTGVPDNPEMTAKDARSVAGPHSSLKYLICCAISKGFSLVTRMTWW